MRKKLILKKIHLESFINTLLDLYDEGVDYIDIEGTPFPIQDKIEINVKEEYMCPEEEMKEEEDNILNKRTGKKLSQEDIDKLIMN